MAIGQQTSCLISDGTNSGEAEVKNAEVDEKIKCYLAEG
jgi:hypothetical protein